MVYIRYTNVRLSVDHSARSNVPYDFMQHMKDTKEGARRQLLTYMSWAAGKEKAPVSFMLSLGNAGPGFLHFDITMMWSGAYNDVPDLPDFMESATRILVHYIVEYMNEKFERLDVGWAVTRREDNRDLEQGIARSLLHLHKVPPPPQLKQALPLASVA